MHKNTTPVRIAVFTFALTLALSGCESEKPAVTEAPKPAAAASPAPAAPQTLFERLGGQEGLTAIVEGLVSNIGADPRTRRHFTNIDMGRIKPKTVEYLCEKTGGPCRYTGDEIQTMSKPLQLNDEDFDAFVEDLTKSLDNKQVAQSDKDELLGILGKLRPEVVGTHGGGP